MSLQARLQDQAVSGGRGPVLAGLAALLWTTAVAVTAQAPRVPPEAAVLVVTGAPARPLL